MLICTVQHTLHIHLTSKVWRSNFIPKSQYQILGQPRKYCSCYIFFNQSYMISKSLAGFVTLFQSICINRICIWCMKMIQWRLGIVMWELVTCILPFQDMTAVQAEFAGQNSLLGHQSRSQIFIQWCEYNVKRAKYWYDDTILESQIPVLQDTTSSLCILPTWHSRNKKKEKVITYSLLKIFGMFVLALLIFRQDFNVWRKLLHINFPSHPNAECWLSRGAFNNEISKIEKLYQKLSCHLMSI